MTELLNHGEKRPDRRRLRIVLRCVIVLLLVLLVLGVIPLVTPRVNDGRFREAQSLLYQSKEALRKDTEQGMDNAMLMEAHRERVRKGYFSSKWYEVSEDVRLEADTTYHFIAHPKDKGLRVVMLAFDVSTGHSSYTSVDP